MSIVDTYQLYPQYCLRLTAQSDLSEISVFSEYLQSRSNWNIFSTENPDTNKHWHFVFSTSTTRQSLVAKIKTLSSVRGNKLYSLTLCRDTVKAIAYVLKDSDYCHYNLPDGLLEQAQAYDLNVKKDLKPGNKLQMYLKLMKEAEVYGDPSPARLLKPVVDYMTLNKILIRTQYLISLWDTYCANTCQRRFLINLEKKILRY